MNNVLFTTDSVSKSDIESFSNHVIDKCLNGDIDPLKVWIKLNALERSIKAIKEGISEASLKEGTKYNGLSVHGAEVKVRENGTKYDYSDCGDEQWNEADIAERSAKSLRIEREQYLKAIKQPYDMVDKDGVVTTIYPPKKISTTGLVITIK